ncbi:hypothetical protein BN8_04607 [Fibrisoma limi BUZ 3]|uniref:Uncharacterized protein n=1 Tax=Fibrisoma limi BUZ 3 TaxID=1185876 RepID=I2GN75_9BACT|nr:hypothetical protein [Fibrisoma limi]CCH55353.1 hypothetical protein BN8_04607 [Fibrisoma limi BUZ 3]
MNAKQKKAGLRAVRMAATTLILAEGCTTTLCVKNFLRNKNYLAYQADVSKWLYAVAKREGWAVNDNGRFRVYYFPSLKPLPQ